MILPIGIGLLASVIVNFIIKSIKFKRLKLRIAIDEQMKADNE